MEMRAFGTGTTRLMPCGQRPEVSGRQLHGGIAMALYAFDGTWNKDSRNEDKDTNVVWFRDAYQGTTCYQPGIRTGFGSAGKVVGGITGAGGRTRVRRMLKGLTQRFRDGDRTIDIVGFSHGAALAVQFANPIHANGVPGLWGTNGAPIRCLGLWDTVPSFSLPVTGFACKRTPRSRRGRATTGSRIGYVSWSGMIRCTIPSCSRTGRSTTTRQSGLRA
jgi:hypothetical protein